VPQLIDDFPSDTATTLAARAASPAGAWELDRLARDFRFAAAAHGLVSPAALPSVPSASAPSQPGGATDQHDWNPHGSTLQAQTAYTAEGNYAAPALQRAQVDATGPWNWPNSQHEFASTSHTEFHAYSGAAVAATGTMHPWGPKVVGCMPSVGRDGAHAESAWEDWEGFPGHDGSGSTNFSALSVERPLAFRICSINFDQAIPPPSPP
jgi:hypothetical protein